MERETLERMTRPLSCRGPDSEGYWFEKHVAFGHRRLAVMDIAGGAQPMSITRGERTITVTFCGEIYNYRELRRELIAKGSEFHSDSDTEVLLHAYMNWGRDLVHRIDGMFAFAIWDSFEQRLLLVRDRLGVKPLFIYPTATGMLFGSEPKAVFANGLVSRRVSIEGLYEVVDMAKTPEATPYTGLFELRPGYFAVLNSQGFRKQRYWSLEPHEHTDDLRRTVSTVRELLEASVNQQSKADVPVCSLLSGGIDSSTVTALAAKCFQRNALPSYSVSFKTLQEFSRDAVRPDDDSPYARETAKHLGLIHTEITLDSSEMLDHELREKILLANDSPPMFWGDMWPSLYLLFKSVRQSNTVALSGEAADELFGGYRWFFNQDAINSEGFPWLTPGSERIFCGLKLLHPELVKILSIGERRMARYRDALNELPTLDSESSFSRRMREITYLNMTRFLQTLLDRKDRMSMAVGLEVRVPFCDHKLVEYVFNVPWEMKSQDGREKSLLRSAVADLLPASVLNRVKNPYPATQSSVYEQGLRNELRGVLSNPSSPVLPFLDLTKAVAVASKEAIGTSFQYNRSSIEVALWLNAWLSSFDVTLELGR